MFHQQFHSQPASTDNSLYETLGVNRNASSQEIKRAFHKKALDHHPDKPGGSNEAFQKINQAHEILMDENKRKTYDRFGMEGFKRGNGNGTGQADIFSQMFGGAFPAGFGGFQQGGASFQFGTSTDGGRTFVFTSSSRNQAPQKAEPVGKTISLTLEDVYAQRIFTTPITVKRKSESSSDRLQDHVEICQLQIKNWEQMQRSTVLGGKGNDAISSSNQTFQRGDIILKPQLSTGPTFVPCNSHDLIFYASITYEDALTGFEFSITFIDPAKTVLTFAFGTKGSSTENLVIESGMVFECSCGLFLSSLITPTKVPEIDFTIENYDKMGSLFIAFDVKPPPVWNFERKSLLVNRLLKPFFTDTDKVPCRRAPLELELRLSKEIFERKLRDKQR